MRHVAVLTAAMVMTLGFPTVAASTHMGPSEPECQEPIQGICDTAEIGGKCNGWIDALCECKSGTGACASGEACTFYVDILGPSCIIG